MNILITRPLIDVEDLMGKLFSLGHKIVHIPTLKISSVKMNSIDTKDIEPMSHPLNLKQELRKDEVTEVNDREVFQKNSNHINDGYYKVPKIID